jgi:hypothetical protein
LFQLTVGGFQLGSNKSIENTKDCKQQTQNSKLKKAYIEKSGDKLTFAYLSYLLRS